MRRGFMGTMLKPRSNRRSGCGKVLLDQKKHGWVGQRSGCCWLCFLIGKALSSWICTTWSDGKQTVVPGSFSAFEGSCAQEEAWIVGKPDLDIAPRQCACWRVAPHQQLSGKTSDIRCAHPPYSPDLAPANFSCFPNLKPLWKEVVSKP